MLPFCFHGFTQCNEDDMTISVSNSCKEFDNGSIVLSGFSNIQPEPGEMYSCLDGDLITGLTIYVGPGELKRLQISAWADITIDGGTLIVCGSVSISKLTIINGGALILNGGSLAIHTEFEIPEGSRLVNANGSVALYKDIQINGLLFNWYGSMISYGKLEKGSTGNIMNHSSFFNASENKVIEDNYDEDLEGAPYSLEWGGFPDKFNNSYIDGLGKGSYTFSVRYGHCFFDKKVEVGELDDLDFSIETINEVDSDCNGSAKINISTGTNDISYQWIKNEELPVIINSNTNYIEGLCSGEYYVLTLKEGHCTQKSFFTIKNGIEHQDEIEDSTIVEIDSLSVMFTNGGENEGWVISGIDTVTYTPDSIDDPALISKFSAKKIIELYKGEFGDQFVGDFENEIIVDEEEESGSIEFIGHYLIEVDASGKLIFNNQDFGQCNRYKVTETSM